MGLLDIARADIKAIASNLNGFGVAITITNLSSETVVITGIHSKHHLGVDTDGNKVNAKNAHISFSESQLTSLGWSIRNNTGEVYLRGYKVAVKDSTGIEKLYVIREWFPSETTGLIVCILEDFE